MPFSYVEIADMATPRAFTVGLGSALVVLGVIHIVRGFEHSNPVAMLRGFRAVVRGIQEIYDVVKAREKSWDDVQKLAFSFAFMLVAPYGKVDDLVMRFVEGLKKKHD
jgi:uncharacterized membrane protein HdeD (DUF308 family)